MMVNVKLGKEMKKDVIISSRACDEVKKSELLAGVEPMTFCIPIKCSNH